MNIYRILIYPALIAFSLFSFSLFKLNQQDLKNYNLDSTKKISGQFQSYNMEETERVVYFNFRLKGISNVFAVPAPEWRSFDFDKFKSTVQAGDSLQVMIPRTAKLSESPISVFQIKYGATYFIDFNKMRQLRKTEMILSLLFGIACIIGVIHHHFKPWI